MLLLLEQGGIVHKSSRKRNSVRARGTGNGKMIFALLEEIVTLQVSFNPINIQEPSFQRPLTWVFNGFKDPLKVIIRVSNHKGVGGSKNSKRSNNRCSSGSKSTCCDGSRDAIVATLGASSASKLVFAVVRILARTATSGRLSDQTGWVGASKKKLLNVAKSFSSFLSEQAG